MKICTKCQELKPLSDFSKDSRRPDGLRSSCRACNAVSRRLYREKNGEKLNAATRAWYAENAEYARQYARDYAAQNSDKVKETRRRYREGHEEEIRAYSREYAEKNAERLQQKRKEQYHADPEAARAKVRKYRLANIERSRERERKWAAEHREERNAQSRDYHARNRDRRLAYHREMLRLKPIERRVRWHRRRARNAQVSGEFTADQWRAMCQYFGDICLCCREVKPLTIDHVVPVSRGGSNTIENIQPLCEPCNSAKRQRSTDYRDPILLAAFLEALQHDAIAA